MHFGRQYEPSLTERQWDIEYTVKSIYSYTAFITIYSYIELYSICITLGNFFNLDFVSPVKCFH